MNKPELKEGEIYVGAIIGADGNQGKRIKELEDMLFARGAMEEAPCFCCGYNGPGYYQPGTHPCAKRHHKLTKGRRLL